MDKKSEHMDPQVMAALVRRYFAGELDDAAMHALEKQSLSDPFLAEALEGFEQHPPDQSMQLASLEARLQQRLVGDDRVMPLAPAASLPPTPVVKMRRFDYRWAAAAAVLLLVAAGGYQWLQTNNNTPSSAIAQSAPATADSTAAGVIDPTPATSDSSLQAVAAAPALRKVASPAPAMAKEERTTWADSAPAAPAAYFDGGRTSGGIVASKPAATPSLSEQLASTAKGLAITRDTIDNREGYLATTTPREQVLNREANAFMNKDSNAGPYNYFANSYRNDRSNLSANAQEKKKAVLFSKPLGNNQDFASAWKKEVADSVITGFDKNVANGLAVKGRVVDEKGTPLPGVVVRYKGASTAVQTNIDGYFSLPANGSDARKVELQYVGFNNIDTLLYATNDVKNLTLKQDAEGLNDVVVVGYGTNTNPAGALAGYQKPRPEAGYDSLQRYLDKSLPNTGTARAKMRIVFTVTPAGKLENFRILNGVSDFVDQQVIELLKEGPAWKPASDARPARVNLAVKVPAPKK